jgi:hypothetical protein
MLPVWPRRVAAGQDLVEAGGGPAFSAGERQNCHRLYRAKK